MMVDDKAIYTISDVGRVIRVWNKRNGALLWQKSIGEIAETSAQLSLVLTEQSLVVANSRTLFCFSKNGGIKWSVGVQDSQWSRISVLKEVVHHLSISNGVLTVRDILLSTGEAKTPKSVVIKSTSWEKCIVAQGLVICALNDSLFSVDFTSSTLDVSEKAIGENIRSISVLDERRFLVKCATSALIFAVSKNAFDKASSIRVSYLACAICNQPYAICNQHHIPVFQLRFPPRWIVS
ncbi:unnamed protein product [Strongylus vulgaris]|uniref:EMC1 first beta-propeller domain-containing protein n=1 Tax=Strongylus vulgaris TaxID=40348 RepID=A0A3P7IUC8_STRVU|nr:unnamed protein product [Strongylus vulgaris]